MGRDPSKPKRVFPSSNFDSSKVSTDASGTESTPNKHEEARKAARSAIHESPILSSPDRTVVTLLRGEFAEMESAGEFPRQRTYLVSSDLSPQATYAMEWTIGTVLREGDVLFVAQALGKDDEPSEERDREANCRTLVEEVKRLLKRTRLQVKVHIEIVAAKTPKHMITEMVPPHNSRPHFPVGLLAVAYKYWQIDYINPTMVILGSRGRSAVKNILLGSFSTYLVAKSSCPVMVARKKLKKSHRKGVSAASLVSSTIHGGLTGVSSIQAARMANNLNLLANAIVDEKDLKRR
jgi:nucleotide-binding universal stress UspA family protein